MGKRIYNFDEFVNESYINEGFFSDIGSKISTWAKNLYNAVKSGIIRLISSGPKSGTPRVALFDDSKSESILDQVNNFYKRTEYYNMNNLQMPETMQESLLWEERVPLEYPMEDDVPNYSEAQIKADIKRSMKEIFRIADEMSDAEKKGASEDEIDDIYRGILDVKPIFIYGAPGIGKTQIVAQVCDELGKELYGHKLSLVNVDGENAEPVDFSGVPSVVDVETPSEKNPIGRGVTRSNVNVDILPYDNGRNQRGGIIFIDELNRMPEEVIKIFMKLAQSRRVGNNYKIPSRWYIVAAGNRKEDDPRGGIKELGTALRDRFEAVNFVPTIKGFRSYVERSRYKDVVLPELLDFLEFQPDFFHNLDPAIKKTKYATPRAWVDASNSLKRSIRELESKGVREIPEDVIRREFNKNVGYDATTAFLNFYKVARDIPIKDLILPYTDPDRAPIPADKGNKPDYTHALMGAVLRKSKEISLTPTEVCNWAKWILRTGLDEEGSAALTSMFTMHPQLQKDPAMFACLSPLADKWSIFLDRK
ncbi:MAG: AAA family ATPase [Spirochaetia bacterium]|nr:AAA family ATPase [Spirochaetia bacterium]